MSKLTISKDHTSNPSLQPAGKDAYEIAAERGITIQEAADAAAKEMEFTGYNDCGQECFVPREAKTYFSFAISDQMFSDGVSIHRNVMSAELVRGLIEEKDDVVFAVNPSHVATLCVARDKFGIDVKVPTTAPKISLKAGDTLIIMQVRGLPRLGGDRHEYTQGEIDSASFTFAAWSVTDGGICPRCAQRCSGCGY